MLSIAMEIEVQRHTPAVQVLSLADNWELISEEICLDSLLAAGDVVDAFTQCAALRLAPDKSWAWSTMDRQATARLTLGGDWLPHKSSKLDLGCMVVCSRQSRSFVQADRVEVALKMLQRLKSLSIRPQQKVVYLLNKIYAGLFWGSEVAYYSRACVCKLRNAVLNALWDSRESRFRSPWLTVLLMFGAECDPEFFHIQRRVLVVRRVLARDNMLRERFASLVDVVENDSKIRGPTMSDDGRHEKAWLVDGWLACTT